MPLQKEIIVIQYLSILESVELILIYQLDVL